MTAVETGPTEAAQGATEPVRPRFSVCIPTMRPGTISTAVASIAAQTFRDFELVVVGQGDEQVLGTAVLAAAGPSFQVRYVHHDGHGASAARNVALAEAFGEIVAFMDDDCEAEPDWLAAIDRSFDPSIGLVSGSLIAPPKVRRGLAVCPSLVVDDRLYDPSTDGETVPEGFGLLSANMAVRRHDALRVGGFDESIGAGTFFGGGEEHDLAFRLMRLGVRMRSTPASIVHHTGGYRYGPKTIYSHKRDRLRGDGAIAAKGFLRENPAGGGEVRRVVWDFLRAQLKTMRPTRLPNASLRVFHSVTAYVQCLRDYELHLGASGEPMTGVLARRQDSDRSRTRPAQRAADGQTAAATC